METAQLAEWCMEQTYAYWSNQLTSFQIEELEKLPNWTWRYYLPPRLARHSDTYIRKWFEKKLSK